MKIRDLLSKKTTFYVPVFILLVSACSSNSNAEEQAGSTSSAESGESSGSGDEPGLLAESSIESVDCPFPEIDRLGSECSTVTVPVRWGDPASGTIDLVVTELRSPETTEGAITVTYLQGGPGGDLLQQLSGAADLLKAVTTDRPFIVIANRTDDDSSASAVLEEPGVDLTAFSTKQMVEDPEAVRL